MTYNFIIRFLHFMMAIILIVLIVTGLTMHTPEMYSLHKSLGMLIFFLAIVRLTARIMQKKKPKNPYIIGRILHIALYFTMIFVPITGYVMSISFGYSVDIFGLQLPSLLSKNIQIGKIAKELHEILAYLMISCIVLHVAFFIYLAFKKRAIAKGMWKTIKLF